MNVLAMNPRPVSQKGFSLVELMVAVTIGLVLLGAISYLLVSSKQIYRTDEDVSRMQENGRYAMEMIGRAIRQAGYRLDVTQPFDGSKATPLMPVEGTEGAAGAPDSITLRHDPSWVKHATNSFRGEEANCSGDVITSDNDLGPGMFNRPVNSKLVVYGFSIVSGQLKCTPVKQDGNQDLPIVVADNVEDMQILYGLDTAGNGNITNYVTASAVNTDILRSQVAAIRVSLLLKGQKPGSAVGTQTYAFNGANVQKIDGFLRQVYTSTFTVRNQAK